MKVDYLIIAENAIVSGGRHFIHAGGWDVVQARHLPLTMPMLSAAARFTFDDAELGSPLTVVLDVADAAGGSVLAQPLVGELLAVRTTREADADDGVRLCVTFTLGEVVFPAEGRYTVVLSGPTGELARESIRVASSGYSDPVPAARAAADGAASARPADDTDGVAHQAGHPPTTMSTGESRRWRPRGAS